jgi:putative endonuclease
MRLSWNFFARDRTNAELGAAGERRAALHYRLRGFSIVGRNVRLGRGEIDLIARRGELLVFAEVKTRRGVGKGAPHEAVDREKQLQIGKLAERWCLEQKITGRTIRFDVISLVWRGWRFELEHFAGAFELLAEAGRPWVRC